MFLIFTQNYKDSLDIRSKIVPLLLVSSVGPEKVPALQECNWRSRVSFYMFTIFQPSRAYSSFRFALFRIDITVVQFGIVFFF